MRNYKILVVDDDPTVIAFIASTLEDSGHVSSAASSSQALRLLPRHVPDLILLSSEPYPCKEKHIAEINMLCPGTPVRLVDGELFSWYGSRLLHAPTYLNGLIQGWTVPAP